MSSWLASRERFSARPLYRRVGRARRTGRAGRSRSPVPAARQPGMERRMDGRTDLPATPSPAHLGEEGGGGDPLAVEDAAQRGDEMLHDQGEPGAGVPRHGAANRSRKRHPRRASRPRRPIRHARRRLGEKSRWPQPGVVPSGRPLAWGRGVGQDGAHAWCTLVGGCSGGSLGEEGTGFVSDETLPSVWEVQGSIFGQMLENPKPPRVLRSHP